MVEINAAKQNTEKKKKERKKRNENSPRDHWGNIKCTYYTLYIIHYTLYIIGVPNGEERE